MPDDTTPRGFSVGDLASPEVISERVRAWAEPMAVEEASANFREAVRKLQRHEGATAEEWWQAGDGIRAVAAQIAEEADRG